MDILSHALYANLVFQKLPAEQKALAVFLSMAPDLISFCFLTIKNFYKKTMHYTDPPLSVIPRHVFGLYNITHSAVIWTMIFIALSALQIKWVAIASLGWLLHILIDIPTHKEGFFPTPIFWPLSNWHFSGINWSNMYFMFGNYIVLAILYFVFYF